MKAFSSWQYPLTSQNDKLLHVWVVDLDASVNCTSNINAGRYSWFGSTFSRNSTRIERNELEPSEIVNDQLVCCVFGVNIFQHTQLSNDSNNILCLECCHTAILLFLFCYLYRKCKQWNTTILLHACCVRLTTIRYVDSPM